MKIVLAVFILFGLYGQSIAQEMRTYDNGMIYSPAAMQNLKHIVDSQNLKFKVCDLNKKFYSLPQAEVEFISITSANKDTIGMLKKLLDEGTSFSDLKDKYAQITQEYQSTTQLLRSVYKRRDETEISYRFITRNGRTQSFPGNITDRHAGAYAVDTHYSNYAKVYYLYAIHFITDLEARELPFKYARKVQYSECLIDTNSTVYTGTNTPHGSSEMNSPKEVRAFYRLMEKSESDKDRNTYTTDWEKKDKLLQTDTKYKLALEKAANALIKEGKGDATIENYAARYLSPSIALDLKRNRTVWGRCSQDQSPRIHAQQIAALAAESNTWEIFLRSHLDIMNDNFNRSSDGSYAWARRLTYIKELEELNINIQDLIFGISLRVDNPSQNHYFGDIGRLGRAMAETKDRDIFEEEALHMINDNTLDNFNRYVIFNLYTSYLYYLPETETANAKIKAIKENKQLPDFLQSAAKELSIRKAK